MEWRIIFWTIVMLLSVLSTADAEEVNGFRGIGWGADISSFKGEEFVKVPAFKGIAPETESYQRKNDELKLAGSEVDSINYNFRRGKLVSVNIDFKGISAYEMLLAFCRERFGPVTATMAKNMEYVTSFESRNTGVLLYLQLGSPQFSFGRLFLYSPDF